MCRLGLPRRIIIVIRQWRIDKRMRLSQILREARVQYCPTFAQQRHQGSPAGSRQRKPRSKHGFQNPQERVGSLRVSGRMFQPFHQTGKGTQFVVRQTIKTTVKLLTGNCHDELNSREPCSPDYRHIWLRALGALLAIAKGWLGRAQLIPVSADRQVDRAGSCRS
jgi:hypothetical protein